MNRLIILQLITIAWPSCNFKAFPKRVLIFFHMLLHFNILVIDSMSPLPQPIFALLG